MRHEEGFTATPPSLAFHCCKVPKRESNYAESASEFKRQGKLTSSKFYSAPTPTPTPTPTTTDKE
jgi:hypothetical protein